MNLTAGAIESANLSELVHLNKVIIDKHLHE